MIILGQVQGLEYIPSYGTGLCWYSQDRYNGLDNIPSTGIQTLMIILRKAQGLENIPSYGSGLYDFIYDESPRTGTLGPDNIPNSGIQRL